MVNFENVGCPDGVGGLANRTQTPKRAFPRDATRKFCLQRSVRYAMATRTPLSLCNDCAVDLNAFLTKWGAACDPRPPMHASIPQTGRARAERRASSMYHLYGYAHAAIRFFA